MRTLLIYNIDPDWDAAERAAAERESRRLGFAIRRQGRPLTLFPVDKADLPDLLAPFNPDETIIFNWCEALPGVERSETQVVSILEELNFTYTGASAEVIELSYDKPRIKNLLRKKGIPTPAWDVFDNTTTDRWNMFPAIVKPAREHCSMGMDFRSVVNNQQELRQQVGRVLAEFMQPALVEDFVDGREFHVPVWGNDEPECLPAAEMDFSALPDMRDRLCSYDAKFTPASRAYREIRTILPARLDTAGTQELNRVCREAYRAAGCRDYGRIDVRLRDGIFYVLDINPNADISADASIAAAAEKAGFCYGALGSRLIDMAAERHLQNRAPHQ